MWFYKTLFLCVTMASLYLHWTANLDGGYVFWVLFFGMVISYCGTTSVSIK